MAVTSNPVTVGGITKKSQYDLLYDMLNDGTNEHISGPIYMENAQDVQMYFQRTDAPTNQKLYRITIDSDGDLEIQPRNDADSANVGGQTIRHDQSSGEWQINAYPIMRWRGGGRVKSDGDESSTNNAPGRNGNVTYKVGAAFTTAGANFQVRNTGTTGEYEIQMPSDESATSLSFSFYPAIAGTILRAVIISSDVVGVKLQNDSGSGVDANWGFQAYAVS